MVLCTWTSQIADNVAGVVGNSRFHLGQSESLVASTLAGHRTRAVDLWPSTCGRTLGRPCSVFDGVVLEMYIGLFPACAMNLLASANLLNPLDIETSPLLPIAATANEHVLSPHVSPPLSLPRMSSSSHSRHESLRRAHPDHDYYNTCCWFPILIYPCFGTIIAVGLVLAVQLQIPLYFALLFIGYSSPTFCLFYLYLWILGSTVLPTHTTKSRVTQNAIRTLYGVTFSLVLALGWALPYTDLLRGLMRVVPFMTWAPALLLVYVILAVIEETRIWRAKRAA